MGLFCCRVVAYVRSHLVVVVLAHSIILGPIFGMIMGEEEHICAHTLYVWILLHEVVVFEFGIQCGPKDHSVSRYLRMVRAVVIRLPNEM